MRGHRLAAVALAGAVAFAGMPPAVVHLIPPQTIIAAARTVTTPRTQL